MDILKELWDKLPLDKLTPTGVLIVAGLIILAVIIAIVNRKKDYIKIKDNGSKIKKSKIGKIKNSNNDKIVKIDLENSEISDSEIGCIENNKNGE